MNPNASYIRDQLTTWFLRRTPAGGVRRVVPLSAAIASDVGNVREDNQDRAAIARGRDKFGRGYLLVSVVDGIGGMEDGGSCAAIVISALISAVDQFAKGNNDNSDQSEMWLRLGAHAANEAVFSKYRASGGSTLVALLVRDGMPAYWLSVGDSRVYCVRNKVLSQVSIDDTIAGQLGKSSDDSREQSQLLQYVGMGVGLEPHTAKLDMSSLESVILTTDGVHFLAKSPGWFSQIIRHSPDPGVCVRRLVDLAKWCGGPDNATVAMVTLPVEKQLPTRPSYSCLEVWDPYGELQIVAAAPFNEGLTSAPSASALGISSKPPSLVITQVSVAPLGSEENQKSSAAPGMKQSRPRRAKSSRKQKKPLAKEEKDTDKLVGSELPQLHMEFPAKSK